MKGKKERGSMKERGRKRKMRREGRKKEGRKKRRERGKEGRKYNLLSPFYLPQLTCTLGQSLKKFCTKVPQPLEDSDKECWTPVCSKWEI